MNLRSSHSALGCGGNTHPSHLTHDAQVDRVKDLAQFLLFACDLTPELTLGDRIVSPLLVDGDPHPSHRQDWDQLDLVARNLRALRGWSR